MKQYIDFQSGAGLGENSGIFAGILGPRPRAVIEALELAMRKYGLHTYTYPTEIRQEYERRLCEWAGYEACALFSDGSRAVEAAMQIIGGTWKGDIRAIADCFHGKTAGPRILLYRTEWPNWGHWIIEGYRGWDAHFWPDSLIDHLKECQRQGYLICFDEIQSGFGRTGKKFAYEHYGIKPDLIVTGKAQGSGFPVSAVLGPRSLLDKADLSCTHGGNPLACAAGLATLDEIERLNLIEESARKGHILHSKLGEVPGLMGRVKGMGMVAALMFDTVAEADSLVMRCQENGLLVVRTGKGSVKLGPPLIIFDEAIVRGVEIIGECL